MGTIFSSIDQELCYLLDFFLCQIKRSFSFLDGKGRLPAVKVDWAWRDLSISSVVEKVREW
jgi:hypothetical protein